MNPDDLLALYEGTGGGTTAVVEGRVRAVKQLRAWCDEQGEHFPPTSNAVAWRYLHYRRSLGRDEGTISNNAYALRNFYKWMEQRGLISPAELPLHDFKATQQEPQPRETLTVDELRRMWEAAPSARHRVIIGLLGLMGLRTDEILTLRVGDFTSISGQVATLSLRNRSGARAHLTHLVPDSVAFEIGVIIGNRRSGPLLFRSDGQPEDRRSIARAASICGERAGLTFKVNTMTLTYSLRAIAIAHGFTYLGVVTAVGEIHPTKARRWIAAHTVPPEQHAAIRLSRLVFAEPGTSAEYLNQADIALNDTDLPDAVAVMAAGAAFESHLRLMCRAAEILMHKTEDRLQIKDYKQVLTGKRLLTKDENSQIQLIENARNNAAHGWFDRIDRQTAQEVIRLCRKIVDANPIDRVKIQSESS